MRIVNRKEFLELPEGTLYSEYEPCCFDGLFIKGKSLKDTNDYIEMSLIGNVVSSDTGDYAEKLENARIDHISIDLDFDEDYGRNGMFAKEQLYAIYEKKDVEKFINLLKSEVVT